jgi:hypothetical protein
MNGTPILTKRPVVTKITRLVAHQPLSCCLNVRIENVAPASMYLWLTLSDVSI